MATKTKKDPTIVKWRIILNARQDILRGMVIKDQFGDGLTLVEGSFRAVRFSPVEGGIRNEAHILSLPVLDNFSKKKLSSTRMKLVRLQDLQLTLEIITIGQCTSNTLLK